MNHHTNQNPRVYIYEAKTQIGATVYVVALVLGQRHLKRMFKHRKDAEEQRDIWVQQIRYASALGRLEGTSLSLQQVRECEVAQRLLQGTCLSLVEAVLIAIRQKHRG